LALSSLPLFSTSLSLGLVQSGRISALGEEDVYSVQASAGETLIVQLGEENITAVQNFSPSLTLLAPTGEILQQDNDYDSAEAELTLTAPVTGTYAIVVKHGRTNGGSLTSTGDYHIKGVVAGRSFAVGSGDQGGALENGEVKDARLARGLFGAWTVKADAGQRIVAQIGEKNRSAVQDFSPALSIYSPTGEFLQDDFDYDAHEAELAISAPITGTYTIIAEHGRTNGRSLTFDGDYQIKSFVTGKPLLVSAGDEGGAMMNGDVQAAKIPAGLFDVWTVEADAGQQVIAQVGEMNRSAVQDFSPALSVYSPTGELMGEDFDYDAHEAEVTVRAKVTGTYAIVVEHGRTNGRSLTLGGDYQVKSYVTGQPMMVAVGDEGGAAGNGTYHDGILPTGMVDIYTVEADAGHTIVAQMGERNRSAVLDFSPAMSIYSPTGELLDDDFDYDAHEAEVSAKAPVTGTYAIVLEHGRTNGRSLTLGGDYRFKAVVTGKVLETSPGDEGGVLRSGEVKAARIELGMMDAWMVKADAGQSIVAQIGERGRTPVQDFSPALSIYSPTGDFMDDDFDYDAHEAEVSVVAPVTGNYLIVAEHGRTNGRSLTLEGDYEIKTLVVGKSLMVTAGDEGGEMVNGETKRGRITTGLFDIWTLSADAGQVVLARLGERNRTPVQDFSPGLAIYGPTGQLLDSEFDYDDDEAEVLITAPRTGTYTLVIEHGRTNGRSLTLNGDYDLTVLAFGNSFAVSAGQSGGPLAGIGAVSGMLGLGSVNVWSFDAIAGRPISITVAEQANLVENFGPWVAIYDPLGQLVTSGSDGSLTTLDFSARRSGTYTVIVRSSGRYDGASYTGSGRYTLNLSGDGARGSSQLLIPTSGSSLVLALEPMVDGSLKLSWSAELINSGAVLEVSDSLDPGSFRPYLPDANPVDDGTSITIQPIAERSFFRLK